MHGSSTNKKYLLSTAMALALSSPLPALAASDYLLEIQGIKGEASEKGCGSAIEIQSWSWGMSEDDRGQACVQDLNFVKELNCITPNLINGFDRGTEYPGAKLSYYGFSDEGQRVLRFEIRLSKVRVSSFQTGGSAGGAPAPMEQVSLDYSEASGTYYPQPGSIGEFAVIPGKCN